VLEEEPVCVCGSDSLEEEPVCVCVALTRWHLQPQESPHVNNSLFTFVLSLSLWLKLSNLSLPVERCYSSGTLSLSLSRLEMKSQRCEMDSLLPVPGSLKEMLVLQ